jgi:hypothetical protein
VKLKLKNHTESPREPIKIGMEVFLSGPNPYRACFEARNNSSGKRFFINFLTLSNCDVLRRL